MKTWVKKNHFIPFIIILTATLAYLPALNKFFHTDDWFHLRITQVNSLEAVLNFFSFSPTGQTASFYRPIPTQLFFFIFQRLFGLKAFFYHGFILLVFSFSLYLAYRLFTMLAKKQIIAYIALFIYAFSVTHFTQVFFISAFQELVLVVFSLLTILAYFKEIKIFKKHQVISTLVFFTLALASKETAVIIPFLILVIDFLQKKKFDKKWLIFLPILFIYLILRFFVFGFNHTTEATTSYQLNLSPKKALNTVFWYGFWSLGAPELLVDYVSSGFKILPRFFSDYEKLAKPLLSLLSTTIISLIAISIFNLIYFYKHKTKGKQTFQLILVGSLFFFISLTPLIPFPTHKFTLELGLPMIGVALVISALLAQLKPVYRWLFLCLFLVTNTLAYYLTYQTHYSIRRALIAQKVYQTIKTQYPSCPNQSLYFINDIPSPNQNWGVSKQISQALNKDDFFKVIYRCQNLKVYYQDDSNLDKDRQNKLIKLKSSQFIR